MVLELPCAFAVRDAEHFALGGVEIFTRLGFVTHLSFGAEDDIAPLEKAAQTALDLTRAAIVETLKDGEPLRYGMQFEKVLPLFWQRIAP